METYQVTFGETMPCTNHVFEVAGEEEFGESIFVGEGDDADWGDLEPTPTAAPIEPTSTTSAHGPEPTATTSYADPIPILHLGDLHLDTNTGDQLYTEALNSLFIIT
jgi:hypothetical protein